MPEAASAAAKVRGPRNVRLISFTLSAPQIHAAPHPFELGAHLRHALLVVVQRRRIIADVLVIFIEQKFELSIERIGRVGWPARSFNERRRKV